MAAKTKIEFPESDYQSFEAEGNFATLRVESKDSEGHVEFQMEDDERDNHTIYLDQEGLKQLIAHLQKQVIEPTKAMSEFNQELYVELQTKLSTIEAQLNSSDLSTEEIMVLETRKSNLQEAINDLK